MFRYRPQPFRRFSAVCRPQLPRGMIARVRGSVSEQCVKSIAAKQTQRLYALERTASRSTSPPSRVDGKMAVLLRLQMLGHYDVLVVVTAFLLCGITQA